MNKKNEKVVFVEFSDGKPCAVITHETHKYGTTEHDYEFAWSKEYGGLLWHESGMGPAAPIDIWQSVMVNPDESLTDVRVVYWAAPGIEIIEPRLCKRLKHLPRKYTARKLFDSYETRHCDSGIVYCSVCDDSMPDEDYHYCKHIWWCDACGQQSTPDERCEHEEETEEDEEVEVAQ